MRLFTLYASEPIADGNDIPSSHVSFFNLRMRGQDRNTAHPVESQKIRILALRRWADVINACREQSKTLSSFATMSNVFFLPQLKFNLWGSDALSNFSHSIQSVIAYACGIQNKVQSPSPPFPHPSSFFLRLQRRSSWARKTKGSL